MDTVLGVDACRGGWVGVAWSGASVTAHFAPTIADLVGLVPRPSVIAIDIPIGLPDRGRRQADLAAREFIRHRRSSVFLTPVRATLGVPEHRRANDINREHTGQGMSIQAFSLLSAIKEVDDWRLDAPCRVVEVHPEVSFTELAGEPPPPKKTWAGAERRRELLSEAGITLAGRLGDTGKAAVDDVLDAAGAAWTARRVHLGTAVPIPNPPQIFSDGVAAAIWR